MFKIIPSALLLGCFCLFATNSYAEQAGQFSVTTGIDYSSGKYGGSSRTDITSVPVVAKYKTEDWVFKLTVPYIWLTGPGNVTPGVGAISSTTTNNRTSVSGLGDVVAGASYHLFTSRDGTAGLDLTGKIKFATGDRNKGLSTGENDYMGQADVFKSFGKVVTFGSLGYRVYGDSNTYKLKDVFYGSVGGMYKLSRSMNTGLMYDYRPAISNTGYEKSELMVFFTNKLDDNWKLQTYALKGMANASPDYALGAFVSYSY